MKKVVLFLLVYTVTLFGESYYFDNGEKRILTKISTQRGLNQNSTTYYKTQKGHKIGVKDEILVQCQDGVNCKEVLQSYSMKKITQLTEKLFVVKISDRDDIFEISQKLYYDKNIKLAHPNFIKSKKRR